MRKGPDHDYNKGTYPWSFVTQIYRNDKPGHGGNRKTFEVMTST